MAPNSLSPATAAAAATSQRWTPHLLVRLSSGMADHAAAPLAHVTLLSVSRQGERGHPLLVVGLWAMPRGSGCELALLEEYYSFIMHAAY